MSGTLTENIAPKRAATPDPTEFTFKRIKPAETISKTSEENQQEMVPNPQPQSLVAADQNGQNVEYKYEPVEFDEEPVDDVLINFLNQFDPLPTPATPNTEAPNAINVPVPVPVVAAPNQVQALANNNMLNIQQVQNVNPGQKMPVLYFPNSNVTINYNFGK